EISLKRKSKPDNDPDFDLEPPKRSFLKKEISFSRKPKEPKAEKQSFLKKEISFSRKPKEQAAPAFADPEAEERRESSWKKEIGFGKKQDRTVEELMQQAAAAVAPEPFDPQRPVAPPHPVELAESVVAAMPDPTAPVPVADVHPVEELPVDTPFVPQGLSPEIVAASSTPEAPSLSSDPPLPGMPALPPAPPARPGPAARAGWGVACARGRRPGPRAVARRGGAPACALGAGAHGRASARPGSRPAARGA